MKIKPSTAKKQCEALDTDCAPPVRCELEAGHEGEHQWSGSRNAPELQADGSHKDKEVPFEKKFSTAPTPIAVVPERPAPPVSASDERVQKVLKQNTK